MFFRSLLPLIPLLAATLTSANPVANANGYGPSDWTGLNAGDRPCGFKIAHCPRGQTCEKLDPSCNRQENCAGRCVRDPTFTPTPTTTTSTSLPTGTLTPQGYSNCGGFRIQQPPTCDGPGLFCVNDPYVEGCGMECDRPGICIEPKKMEFCGGFGGFVCAADKICVDDPSDECDPHDGGADCGGVCV